MLLALVVFCINTALCINGLSINLWGKSAQTSSSLKKTIIVTGANSGIGFSAVKQILAQHADEFQIVFAGRSEERANKAIASLPLSAQNNVEFQYVDLSDLQSVRAFCDSFLLKKQQLYGLALNAGLQVGPTKIAPTTVQGFEQTVGTNHLGHFLLLQRLLPLLERSGKACRTASRVVITASGVHNPEEGGGNVGKPASLGDLTGFKNGFLCPENSMVDGNAPYDSDKSYKDSKLLNVITTLEQHRRLSSKQLTKYVTVNCFNPGLAPTTGLFRNYSPLFVIPFTFLTRTVFKVAVSEEEAGARLSYLLTNKDIDGISGQYFTGKPGKDEFYSTSPSKEAQDIDKAKEVWNWSERLVSNYNKK